MDELTQLIKKNIKSKYSTTKNLADELGIPATTILSALNNGIGSTSYTTVSKICAALDIRIMNGLYPVEVPEFTKSIIEKLSKLDEKGLHTVSTVLEMEYIRCKYEAENVSIAEKISMGEDALTYPVVENSQLPTRSSVLNLMKALDENEDLIK